MDKERENQNLHLPLAQRVARVFGDEDFRNHCQRLAAQPGFEEDFVMCEKIARQSTRGIQINEDLLHLKKPFDIEEIRQGVFEFYNFLDSLADGLNLSEKFNKNMVYLTTDNQGRENQGSCCGYTKEDDGSIKREIFCNMEGRPSDITTVAHEFCHSMSESFEKAEPHKDVRMREVCTVIVDALSNEYFKEKYPNLRENFIENALHTQVVNVGKARECLLEGIVIKIMIGQMKVEEAQAKYGELIGHDQRMLNHCLESIEHINFAGMEQRKYLLPQAIALEMLDKFRKNPEKTVSQFKQVLKDDAKLTFEEALEIMQLPSKDKLIDDYVGKYETRTNALLDEAYEDELY